MSDFQRALPVADLPPGGGWPIVIGDRTVAVFNVDGAFYAIDDTCPHRGASLAEGALIGTTVVCPRHRWTFDVRSGANPVTPDLCVRSYPVEIRDGVVWVDVAGNADVNRSNFASRQP